MTDSKLAIMLAGFSLFIAVIALGQRQSDNRFPSSQIPASLTELDWNLTEANLALLRDAHGYDKDGIGVPWLYFDQKTGKVKALAWVDGDKLGRVSTDLTKATLLSHVALTRLIAATFIPELKGFPEVDLEMEFEGLAVKRMFGEAKSQQLGEYTFYAKYSNGGLMIRQDVPHIK